jgi:hypothetical protein
VHGVGTEQNPFCTRTLQPQRRLRQDLTGFIPLTARLAGFYLMEIDAVQQQACGVQSAKTCFTPSLIRR